MNGAESLVHTLIGGGVEVCFANPGTSEMHFVAALDNIAGIRCVLGLQENVVTGMADGYFRIARKPACTLLHLGPGLANGIANLHNARRARSGIVNIVGDHAVYHRPLDAPLTSDIDALARTTSSWVRTSQQAQEVGRDCADAMVAANTAPGNIATLILPADASWEDGGLAVIPVASPASPAISPLALANAAAALRSGKRTLLLLGGEAANAEAQRVAFDISAHSGAALLAEYSIGRVARGQGRGPLERVPYDGEKAIQALAQFDHIILVNAKPPVGFFGYPGQPSRHYRSDAQIHELSRFDQDPLEALKALADEVGATRAPLPVSGSRPEPATGAPTPEGLARTIAAVMPEHAIVSDESVSFGRGFYAHTHAAPAHDWLHLTGGAIGDGLPVATGAAIAGKDRRVISIQADGSAMYSLQSLWTQAREGLPCTTILLSNRKYNILIGEYGRVGANAGPTAMDMLSLTNPDLDWVKLAEGMGVEAARAETLEACAALLTASFSRPGPFLIELMI